ncbi:atg6 [[Candida] subhashii]|uniref:Atg6 n=1 Tax=[Candida] subhashii TaxID=561895 RepID=A0A8J5QLQ2_9ASCO|nr:atg6 [[Candida] subhashii]KAG7664438.1 atg6 [[Candida] subhashii]
MSEDEFNCQKCDTPLELDESLKNLNISQLSHLVNERQDKQFEKANIKILDDLDPQEYIPKERLDLYNQVNKGNIEPIQYRNYLESDEEDDDEDENDDFEDEDGSSGSNSYLVLDEETGDSDEENGTINGNHEQRQENEEDREIRMSSRIKTLTKIFEILSNNQDIDHPLSEDCASLLIENYKLKFDQSQKEKDNYLSFLRKLKDKDNQLNLYDNEHNEEFNPNLSNEDLDMKLTQSIEEFKELTLLEKTSLQKLKDLENSRNELDSQLKKYEKELEDLQNDGLDKILRLKNKLQLELNDKRNKLEQSKAAYHVHLDHIDKLRNLNIYNKIFNISCDSDDKYGTINGFRIGYKVVWPEINAALGQIISLLVFLVKRLNLKSSTYKLVPMGSQSQIIKFSTVSSDEGSTSSGQTTKSKTVLNMYSSDEFSLGKLFNFNKLDVSMISLLDVVSQIETRLRSLDADIDLPYKISPTKDSIGGKSIRVTSNTEWTQSCKFLLTDLKWMLTFISAHTSPNNT